MSNLAASGSVPHAANLVDASLGTATFTATVTPLRVRLLTVIGTLVTAGTELATGSGYTSGAGAPTMTFTGAAVQVAGSTSSAIAGNVSFTLINMPAVGGGGIVGVELWDSAGTPLRKWWGPLTTPKTFNLGDTLTFPASSLTAAT